MSWKPRPNSDNKQWRRPKQDNEDENNYPNHYNNYNNRSQRSYNSHSNYQYNNKNRNHNYNHSNYNRNNNGNAYHPNNRQYKHNQSNYNHHKYNQYNRYNQQNNNYNQRNYSQKTYNQNNNNQTWINKNSKNVKYCKNTGKFIIEEIPLNELTSTLQSIWDRHYNKNVQYIEKIVFLCGPPGSGKTSICNYVEQYYDLNTLNHDQYMIDVSNLLSIVMKENNRALIMSKVYELLFKHILENTKHNKILIVDGFLRKEQHVSVLTFLQLQMQHTQFIFLVINVDEATSIKRQLERGQKLLQLSHNNENEEKEKNAKYMDLFVAHLESRSANNSFKLFSPIGIYVISSSCDRDKKRFCNSIEEELLSLFSNETWIAKQEACKQLLPIERSQFEIQIERHEQIMNSLTLTGLAHNVGLLGSSNKEKSGVMRILKHTHSNSHKHHSKKHHKWEDHFFVLAHSTLYYFQHDPDAQITHSSMPKSFIPLKYANIQLDIDRIKSDRFVFYISTPLRTVYLRCRHPVALAEWVSSLLKAINRHTNNNNNNALKLIESKDILNKIRIIRSKVSTLNNLLKEKKKDRKS
eukprot:49371_1